MDLAELGIVVNPAPSESGIKKIAASLRALERQAKTATGLIEKGFQGSGTSAMQAAADLNKVGSEIAKVQRKLAAAKKGLDQPGKSSTVRALERDLQALKKLEAEYEKFALKQAELIKSVNAASAEAAAQRKAQAKATFEFESRLEAARTDARQRNIALQNRLEADQAARQQERIAQLAQAQTQVTTALAVQTEAQELLRQRMDLTVKEAERYAQVINSMRGNGATEEQILEYKRLIATLQVARKETLNLAAAQAGGAATTVSGPAKIVGGSERSLLIEREALAAIEQGYFLTRAAALKYAEAKIELLAIGGSDTEVKRLLEASAATERLTQASQRLTQTKIYNLDLTKVEGDVARSNAAIINSMLEAQQIGLLRVREAQALVTQGIVLSSEAAGVLAGEFLALKALGADINQQAAWLANAKSIQVENAALEANITLLEKDAALRGKSVQPRGLRSTAAADATRATKGLENSRSKFQQWEHSITRVRTGLFSILSILTILGLDRLARGLVEVNKLTNEFARGLDLITHSSAATADTLVRVKKVANDLGLEYAILASNFVKFALAAQGQLSLGETEAVFTGVSEALRALGKDQVDTERVFKALEQMVGKGVVSMEELRGQLSESLPVAMRIMARELGITRGALITMVSQGALPARDAVIALSTGLHKDFAAAAEAAANTIPGAFARIQNSIFDMYDALLGSGGSQKMLDALIAFNDALNNPETRKTLSDLVTGLINLSTWLIENTSNIVEFVSVLTKALVIYLFVKGVIALVGALYSLVAILPVAIAWMSKFLILAAGAGASIGGLLAASILVLLGLVALVASAFVDWSDIIDWVKTKMAELGLTTVPAATESIKTLTEAEKDLAAEVERQQKALLAQSEALSAVSKGASDAAKDLQSMRDVKSGEEILLKRGMPQSVVDTISTKDLEAVGAMERQLFNERMRMQGSVNKYSDETLRALQKNYEEEEATQKLYIENIMVAMRGNEEFEKGRQIRKQAASEAEAAAKSYNEAMRKQRLDLMAQEQALGLLINGFADTSRQADEYAERLRTLAASNKDHSAAGEARLKQDQAALLLEAQIVSKRMEANQRQIDAIDDYHKAVKDLAKTEAELSIQTKIMLDPRVSKDADIGAIAEQYRLLVEREGLTVEGVSRSADQQKRFLDLAIDSRTEIERLTATLNQQKKVIEAEAGVFASQIQASLSALEDPEIDLSFLTDMIQPIMEMRPLLNMELEVYKGIEESIRRSNALLAIQARLKSTQRDMASERTLRAVITSSSRRGSRTDPRKITELVEEKRRAAPIGSEFNLDQAIKEAEQFQKSLDDIAKRTERITEAARTSSMVWGELIDEWSNATPMIVRIDEAFASAAQTFKDQVGDSVASVALGFQSLDEAAKSLAQTILRELINAIVTAGIEWAATKMFGAMGAGNNDIKAIEAKTEAELKAIATITAAQLAADAALYATSSALAGALLTSWTPAAIAASTATMGAAGLAGLAAFEAAIAGGTIASTATQYPQLTGALGGGMATGGPVDSGVTYMVGEKGPELFTPNRSGTIIPNHQLGGEAPQVTVPVTVKVVNNTGTASTASVNQSTNADGSQLITLTLNAVAQDIATNGRVAQAMSTKYGLSQRLGVRS